MCCAVTLVGFRHLCGADCCCCFFITLLKPKCHKVWTLCGTEWLWVSSSGCIYTVVSCGGLWLYVDATASIVAVNSSLLSPVLCCK